MDVSLVAEVTLEGSASFRDGLGLRGAFELVVAGVSSVALVYVARSSEELRSKIQDWGRDPWAIAFGWSSGGVGLCTWTPRLQYRCSWSSGLQVVGLLVGVFAVLGTSCPQVPEYAENNKSCRFIGDPAAFTICGRTQSLTTRSPTFKNGGNRPCSKRPRASHKTAPLQIDSLH